MSLLVTSAAALFYTGFTVVDNDNDICVLSVGMGCGGSCFRSQGGLLSVILHVSFTGS